MDKTDAQQPGEFLKRNRAQLLVDPELLQLLVCPLTRSRLRQEGDELVGEVGGLRYPIRDQIPVLLIDQAKLPQGVASLDEFRRQFADYIPD